MIFCAGGYLLSIGIFIYECLNKKDVEAANFAKSSKAAIAAEYILNLKDIDESLFEE